MPRETEEAAIRSLLEQIARGDEAGQNVLEGAGGLEAATREIDPENIVQNFADRMRRLPADEISDTAALEEATRVVIEQTRSSLAKARSGDLSSFTRIERSAMEAIVIADGSRPALLLRNGEPPADHPLANEWKDELAHFKDDIRGYASAVCRIEPTHGSAGNYFGTGFLVDKDNGTVVTNQHVLEKLLRTGSTLAERTGDAIRIYDGVYVDFTGEINSAARSRFKVVGARATLVEGSGLERLDVATLTIEPIAGRPDFPEPIMLDATNNDADGSLMSFCIIGFPGPPPVAFGTRDGVDFSWVHRTLFGGKYGLKRIAPGTVHRAVGTVSGDRRKWVFGHTASTLGGNSGSPVLAWLDGSHAFGIHFAGYTKETNQAHSIYKAKNKLIQMGLPIGS